MMLPGPANGEAIVSETVMRYIAMLQHVPRHGGGITAAELHAKLLNLEFVIDKRGVERDLFSVVPEGHCPDVKRHIMSSKVASIPCG